jgi:hypothetical protein
MSSDPRWVLFSSFSLSSSTATAQLQGEPPKRLDDDRLFLFPHVL